MRIAVASFGQETCSFTPLPTTLEHFRQFGIDEGEAVIEKRRGVGTIGGFLAAAEEEGIDLVPLPLIHGWAGAGGIITADVIDYFERELTTRLQKVLPIDGMFFSIHGAAASTKTDDAEGYLLAAVRRVIGPNVPLVASMDHHAFITRQKIAMLSALVGHRTQPHDPFDTGKRAAKILFALVRGEIRPAMVYQRIPMVTHQEQFLTSKGPMKEWFDLARELETLPGVISISNFPMQPWLDVEEGGWASVVVTDNDLPLARRLAAQLANKAWSLREALWKMDSIPPDQAVRRAVQAEKGLVVLSDTGDTIWGGAVGDSTCILSEMLRQRIPATALVPILDAEVVEAAMQAGLGSEITVKVGGKIDKVFTTPVEITGKVAGIGGGRFNAEVVGQNSFDLGRAVLLEVGNIKLLVTEFRGHSGNHPIVYQSFGIDPAQAKMVVVKTSSNWQYYRQWTSEVIRVDTPGPTMSHLERFQWKRIPRPIWPLDDLQQWHAEP
jgi:microcystin degradation protein MlrC